VEVCALLSVVLVLSVFVDVDVDRKRRYHSTFNEVSSPSDDVSPKRGCFDCALSADGHGQLRPDPAINGGPDDGATEHRQISFSPAKLAREETRSPLEQQHPRRFPVVPIPRFPTVPLLPTSAALIPPTSGMAAHFRSVLPLPPPPFRFPPSVDYRTAVLPSSASLPPPPLPPFTFYHPAFWGTVPYLVTRALALYGGEQPAEVPVSGYQSTSPVHVRPRSPDSDLCQSPSRCREPPTVRRRFCDLLVSQLPGVGLRPLPEATSTGLDDMAKMVSRLDDATNIVI